MPENESSTTVIFEEDTENEILEELQTLEDSINQFMDDRIQVAHQMMRAGDNARTYQEYQNEHERLHKEVYRQLGGDKAAWDLLNQLDSVEASLDGMAEDTIYIQGLRDGFKFATFPGGKPPIYPVFPRMQDVLELLKTGG